MFGRGALLNRFKEEIFIHSFVQGCLENISRFKYLQFLSDVSGWSDQ